jgi:hypothetical protein
MLRRALAAFQMGDIRQACMDAYEVVIGDIYEEYKSGVLQEIPSDLRQEIKV